MFSRFCNLNNCNHTKRFLQILFTESFLEIYLCVCVYIFNIASSFILRIYSSISIFPFMDICIFSLFDQLTQCGYEHSYACPWFPHRRSLGYLWKSAIVVVHRTRVCSTQNNTTLHYKETTLISIHTHSAQISHFSKPQK